MARRTGGRRAAGGSMIDTKRSGPPLGPGPEITSSHHHEAAIGIEPSSRRNQCTGSVAELPSVPFGRDYPDTDLWVDRDGRVYRGDGPFLNRPLRRLRRWWLR